MAGELVLITGVSGHVGFAVLVEALKNGYKARAVVRNESQIAHIKGIKSIQPYTESIEYALVADFTSPRAFDAHVGGVAYVIHVAAPPFPSVDVPVDVAEFAATTRTMTKNILDAASKTKSVKRVIITSSITTLFSGVGLQGDSDVVLDWQSNVARDLVSPVPEKATGIIAYVISKVLSALDVEKYVEENKPHYSVVSILLGTTIGRNELAQSSQDLLKGSNIVALAPLLGLSFPPTQSVFIHLDDAALSHIRALNIDVRPGMVRKIIPVFNTAATPDAFTWDDIIEIVKKAFPGVVESGAFPLDGSVPKRKTLVDSAEDERVLGMKFKTYEEAVIDLVSQFLELAQAAQK